MVDANIPPDAVTVTVSYNSTLESFILPSSATTTDLSDAIASRLSVPPENQKLVVPKLGLLKSPFSSAPAASALQGKKIRLIGATAQAASSIQHVADVAARRLENRAAAYRKSSALAPAHAGRPRNNFGKAAEESAYTFHSIRPLAHLPDPPASLRYLERLAADPGIRQTMRRRGMAVGLLTEMDPAAHTDVSHDGVGRTLGLNKNKGEEILLRLRTDAGDGYRDYKTVRRTLCHELAHNVHSDHDASFWKLCREIEREVDGVERGDRTLEEREGPEGPIGREEEDDFAHDHGGWEGGKFVLGGNNGDGSAGLSGREMMARAAEERIRKLRRDKDGENNNNNQNASSRQR